MQIFSLELLFIYVKFYGIDIHLFMRHNIMPKKRDRAARLINVSPRIILHYITAVCKESEKIFIDLEYFNQYDLTISGNNNF